MFPNLCTILQDIARNGASLDCSGTFFGSLLIGISMFLCHANFLPWILSLMLASKQRHRDTKGKEQNLQHESVTSTWKWIRDFNHRALYQDHTSIAFLLQINAEAEIHNSIRSDLCFVRVDLLETSQALSSWLPETPPSGPPPTLKCTWGFLERHVEHFFGSLMLNC